MQCQRRAVMARLNRLRTCDQPFAGLLASGLFSTGFGFSSERAASAAWKPILEWVPSQKGLFTLPPHRQSENAFFPVRSSFFPLASSSSTSPSSHSTRYGPLGRIVIFTAMPFSLRYLTYITLRVNTLTSSIESMLQTILSLFRWELSLCSGQAFNSCGKPHSRPSDRHPHPQRYRTYDDPAE